MNDDEAYQRTQALNQDHVLAAISGNDEERKHAAVAMVAATHGAQLASHDHTIGTLVDAQVDLLRRITNAERSAREFRDDFAAVNRRITKYTLIGLALLLVLSWLT